MIKSIEVDSDSVVVNSVAVHVRDGRGETALCAFFYVDYVGYNGYNSKYVPFEYDIEAKEFSRIPFAHTRVDNMESLQESLEKMTTHKKVCEEIINALSAAING